MLPNFLILGAQKAGTTTLITYLERHPDVFTPKVRETRFFAHPNLFWRGVAHYESEFFGDWDGERAVGEKTPDYLVYPEIPGRIREVLGDELRFVVCLRSPAARAHSGHRHNLARGRENLTFEEALAAEPARTAKGAGFYSAFGYRVRGLYARQIRNYVAVFPRFLEQTMFIDLADLSSDQKGVLEALCRWIGVKPRAPAEYISAGRPKLATQPPRIGRKGIRWRGKRVRNPSPEFRVFCEQHHRAVESVTALSREDELRLNAELFRDDIVELEEMLGRSFAHWLE